MSFSKDFVWGAATSAYQIEGAALEDGKGISIWDTFTKLSGVIKNDDTGEIACDHYHRYREDVALMKEIGLKAYRFSINWTRVLPDGTGKINEAGLQFYDNLVDELLKAGITPYITLFHWEYPQALQDKGGWLNKDSSDWFAEYVKVIVERLSDRVTHWITLNEPQCFVNIGYKDGTWAPKLQLSNKELFTIAHHVLLAHGKAVQTIRNYTKQPCEIGYAPVGTTVIPLTESEEDRKAAKQIMFSCDKEAIVWANTWWMDPVYLGKYPEDGLKNYEEFLPDIKTQDMNTIYQPLDFFACNTYLAEYVRWNKQLQTPEYVKHVSGYNQTAMKWAVTPSALYYGSKFFYERYQKPILITENGLSNADWISLDGKIHDPQRIDFLNRYLLEYQRAASEGIPLKGYFCWSLMDNFEWAEGYNERFGLIYVDYQTQKRTLKNSAYWYKTVIQSNGKSLYVK